MPNIHLYPVFHIVVDVDRVSDPEQAIDEASAELADRLARVEFTLDEETTAEYAGEFVEARAYVAGRKRRRPSHALTVADYVQQLDFLIDGQEDELAEILRPIREFLSDQLERHAEQGKLNIGSE